MRRTQRRAQRTTEDSSVVWRWRRSTISPASSGWSDDTASGCILHPSRQDPSLAAQLREDPGSMMTQSTRRRVYSTMRLIRTGMLGQLASLQQWEEAMHRQDDACTLWRSEQYAHTKNMNIIYVDSFMNIRYLAQVALFHYYIIIHFVIIHISVLVSLHYYVMSLHIARIQFICVRYV